MYTIQLQLHFIERFNIQLIQHEKPITTTIHHGKI